MFLAIRRIFDYSGRTNRREYWSFFIGWFILLVLAAIWVKNYQDTHFGSQPQLADEDAAVFFLILFGLVGLPGLSLKVRRFHDFGWSGWSVLWTFVPIVNLVMEIMLLFRGSSSVQAEVVDQEPRHITIYNTPSAIGGETPRSSSQHVDQIARLADLHAQGMLSPQEFAAAKAKVLQS